MPTSLPSMMPGRTPSDSWNVVAPLNQEAADPLPRAARDLLRRCIDIYDEAAALARSAVGNGPPEALLNRVEALASFAWQHHPGRYADATIENIAFEIGASLNDAKFANLVRKPANVGSSQTCRRVLHVASTVYSVGGHTRLISRWADLDGTSQHSLFVTRQADSPIPAWLAEVIARRGGSVVLPPAGGSKIDAAMHLRAAARNDADLVVLHTHPNDCIATVALAVDDLPPVALLNHADHVFWLGSSVADLLIDFRESGADLARRRRFVQEQFLLPLPLSVPDEESPSRRAECRALLGVGENEQVLLSVGSPYKYQPTEREDFFRAAKAILDRVPTARLLLVGVSAADYQRFGKRTEIERLHLVGPVDDTLPYNRAADVYLEGVPLGSCTALLEAAGLGIPVVRSYQSLSALLVSDDPAIDALVDRPTSEEDYVGTAVRLLRESQTRQSVGAALRKAVVNSHTGDGWLDRLEALYQRLKSRTHSPARLPPASAEETADDIALAYIERNDVCNVEWFVDHVLPSQSHGALIATLCSIHRMTSRRLIHPSKRRYLRTLQGWLRGAPRSRRRA